MCSYLVCVSCSDWRVSIKAIIKQVILAARARVLISLDLRNAGLAVAVVTAGDLVGLTENQQTKSQFLVCYAFPH